MMGGQLRTLSSVVETPVSIDRIPPQTRRALVNMLTLLPVALFFAKVNLRHRLLFGTDGAYGQGAEHE